MIFIVRRQIKDGIKIIFYKGVYSLEPWREKGNLSERRILEKQTVKILKTGLFLIFLIVFNESCRKTLRKTSLKNLKMRLF